MPETITRPGQEQTMVRNVLGRIGMTSPNAATLVVTASATTSASPEEVWDTWAKLDKWSTWSTPLHVSARWLEGRTWEVGAKIEQISNLGFPFGRSVSLDLVKEVNQHRSVSWWKSSNGVRSCHIWFFEHLPDGGTKVTKTEAFVGLAIWVTKPIIRKRWQGLFQASVDGLMQAVERDRPRY